MANMPIHKDWDKVVKAFENFDKRHSADIDNEAGMDSGIEDIATSLIAVDDEIGEVQRLLAKHWS